MKSHLTAEFAFSGSLNRSGRHREAPCSSYFARCYSKVLDKDISREEDSIQAHSLGPSCGCSGSKSLRLQCIQSPEAGRDMLVLLLLSLFI